MYYTEAVENELLVDINYKKVIKDDMKLQHMRHACYAMCLLYMCIYISISVIAEAFQI